MAVAPLAPTATQCTGELQDTDPSALNVAALGVAQDRPGRAVHCSVKAVSVVPAWSI